MQDEMLICFSIVIILLKAYFYLCVYPPLLCVYVHICVGAHRGQKSTLGTLELEL